MKRKQTGSQEITIYQSEDGKISFNVNVFEETVWLTQKQMAELFDKSIKTISEHILNIFEEGEVEEKVAFRNFRHTTQHGAIVGKTQEKEVKYYNLDVIISVGYRVKSKRGIQFRKWATKVLKQYLINGYAINENRIREIRYSIDELVKSQKVLKEDVSRIEKLLVNLIERPIVIHAHSHNQISIDNQLEQKLIKLLDKIITSLGEEKAVSQIRTIKKDLSNPSNQHSKKRIFNFFREVGDEDSDIHKAIKGAGIARNIVSELLKIGEKLKNFL